MFALKMAASEYTFSPMMILTLEEIHQFLLSDGKWDNSQTPHQNSGDDKVSENFREQPYNDHRLEPLKLHEGRHPNGVNGG